jgi:hypothetical protein
MGDCVTNVIEVGAEPASDVQLGGQYAVKIVHDIVENDQWDYVQIAVVQKENNKGKYSENGRYTGQIPIDEISQRTAYVQDTSASRTKK